MLFLSGRDQIPRRSEHGKLSSTLSATICLFPSSQPFWKNKHHLAESDSRFSSKSDLAYSQVTCLRFTRLDHWMLDNMVDDPQATIQKIIPSTLPSGINKIIYSKFITQENHSLYALDMSWTDTFSKFTSSKLIHFANDFSPSSPYMADYKCFRNTHMEWPCRLHGIGFVQTSCLKETRQKAMRAPENSQQEGTKADKDTKMHLGLPNFLLLGQKWTCLIHYSFLG